MLEPIDQYLVDSIEGKSDACQVKVDYKLPANSMVVSPDVFARIKEFSDAHACLNNKH